MIVNWQTAVVEKVNYCLHKSWC